MPFLGLLLAWIFLLLPQLWALNRSCKLDPVSTTKPYTLCSNCWALSWKILPRITTSVQMWKDRSHPAFESTQCQSEANYGEIVTWFPCVNTRVNRRLWRQENEYPLGITVAKSEGMKLREERRLDSNDLCVELCRPGHGWCARQEDHPLGHLKTKEPKMLSTQWGGSVRDCYPTKDSLRQNIDHATMRQELDATTAHPRNSKSPQAAAALSFTSWALSLWAVLNFIYIY